MSLVNHSNAHTGGFLGSDQGAVTGCTGKGLGSSGSCGIKQFFGIKGGGKRRKRSRITRKRKKRRRRRKRGGATTNRLEPFKGKVAMLTRGGNASRGLSAGEMRTIRGGGQGYGMTTESARAQATAGVPSGLGQGYHNHATTAVSMYKDCAITPPEKLGAGSLYVGTRLIQSGAGNQGILRPAHVGRPAGITVDDYNQYDAASYGYTHPSPSGNEELSGYHAPITNLSRSQRCVRGGGKQRKGGKSRKCKGGRSLRDLGSDIVMAPVNIAQGLNKFVGDRFIEVPQSGGTRKRRRRRRKRKRRRTKHRRRRKRRRRRRRTRKRQRGGYAQWRSNVPLTYTMQLPNGTGGGTWEGQLATPPTYARTDLCNNNYNHFTRQNSPSPVLDQAVRST